MPTSRAASPCRPVWCTAGAADMTCRPASSTRPQFFLITMRKLSCPRGRETSDHRQHPDTPCGLVIDQYLMKFFLYEIVARIIAIYLCLDCSRTLWYGLVERKIAYFNADFIDWLLVDWSKVVAHRDATPVRYWIQIGIRISLLVASLFVAIFGWWQPNT